MGRERTGRQGPGTPGVREDRGPVRYGPPAPGPGLPVLPELAEVLAAAAGDGAPEPAGGSAALREAARAYWDRRGLHGGAEHVAAAPGTSPLILALIAAHGGDVLMPRPCPASWIPQARLLGRPAYHVPTPAECGGVPDPYALLETVRRVRAEGGRPRLLLISVVDDPTATVAPPELVREACEAAVAEGLHIVSDETWRDTLHRPHDTVLLSPAEMCPDDVTVVSDLAGALTPSAWPVAVARFPDTPRPRCATPVRSTSSPRSAPSSRARSPRRPPTRCANRTPSPNGSAGPPRCRPGSPPRPIRRCSPPARSPGPRRPAATSTRTSARSAPGSPPAASRTRWSWRNTSRTGSAHRSPAATASVTNWARCGCGWAPDHCSDRPRGSSWSRSPRWSPSNCRTSRQP